MDNYKLTTWEVASTLAIVTLTPVLLSYPQYNAKTYGTAYMLHSIYMAIVMFIIFWIGLKLYKPFVGKDILDVAEMLGGKKLKIISGILFLSYLILIVISCILYHKTKMRKYKSFYYLQTYCVCYCG